MRKIMFQVLLVVFLLVGCNNTSQKLNEKVAIEPSKIKTQEADKKENIKKADAENTNAESTNAENANIKNTYNENTETKKADHINEKESSNKEESEDDFNQISIFWSNFRNLILNYKINDIENLTQFPLETRGPMDYHPTIKFERDKFQKVFTLFLNENLNRIKDSEKLYFKNLVDYNKPLDRTKFADYTKIVLVNNNYADICGMVFKCEDNKWNLNFIYLSEESYKKLGIDIEK